MWLCVLLCAMGVVSCRADTARCTGIQFPVCTFGSDADSSNIPPVLYTGAMVVRPLRYDPWLGRDKFLHCAVSAGISSMGYLSFRHLTDAGDARSRWAASLGTLGIALLKEERDRRRPESFFSVRDLVADMVGIGVGLLIVGR